MNQVPATLGYTQGTGSSSSSQFIEFFSERDPTANDTQHPIQKRWFNVTTNTEWILVSFTTTNAILQSNWQEITTASPAVLSFTGGVGSTGIFPVTPNVSGSITLSSTVTTSATSIQITGTPFSQLIFVIRNAPINNISGISGNAVPTTTGGVSLTSTSGSLSIVASGNSVNFDLPGFTAPTSYTPTITSSGGAVTATYGAFRVGRYSVTNGVCTCSFAIAGNISAAAAGDCEISLPLPCVTLANFNCYGSGYFALNSDTSVYAASLQVFSGESIVTIHQYVASIPGPVNAPISTGDFNLQGTITYFVA